MPLRPVSDSSSKLEHRIGLGLGLAGIGIVLVFVLKLLLPWILLAGLGLGGLWIWHRQQAFEKSLYILFYDLIEANQGRISVLDFAKASKLSGQQARLFLDARAREFYAGFEPTDIGDIIYTFRSPDAAPTASPAGVSHLSVLVTEPVATPLILSLDQLAQRLGCTTALLRHRHTAPDFYDWSQAQDPQSRGWTYDPLTASYRHDPAARIMRSSDKS